jgi:hypothetical protein
MYYALNWYQGIDIVGECQGNIETLIIINNRINALFLLTIMINDMVQT